MKFAACSVSGVDRIGIVEGDDLVLLPAGAGDLVSLIEGGQNALRSVSGDLASGERVPLSGCRLQSPIGRFRRDVLCTGWNYWDHFEESKGKRDGQDVDAPKAPTFFTKAPTAIIGPHDPIAFDDRLSQKWDYEGEIVVVIGKKGRSIPAAKAMDHVFGFMLANDVSQRDLQRRHGGQWLKGKSIDGTTPLGPYLVTANEIDLPSTRIETFVNGERRQDAYARQMAFDLGRLISELSFGMTLFPGDVLLTGTPSGIGAARTPPLFLTEGDEIVVRATGLGELRNTMTKTDLYGESDLSLT